MRVTAGGLLACALMAACQPDARPDADSLDRAAAYGRAADAPRPVEITARLEQILFEQQAPSYVRPRLWHLLRNSYDRRQYQPYWVDSAGDARAAALVAAVCRAEDEGLRSRDYGIERLMQELSALGENTRGSADHLARIDLMLSGALLGYSEDLLMGRLTPDSTSDWHVSVPREEVERLLQRILMADLPLDSTFAALRPRTAAYAALVGRLRELRAVAAAGGWQEVPPGETLRRGMRGERVDALRRRLAAGGELAPDDTAAGRAFDAPLAAAVARFQRAHRYDADRVVGKRTIAALNVPVELRIAQVEATLERYRWIPDELLARYALINVPEERLRTFAAGLVVSDMAARTTPAVADSLPHALADTLTQVVVHPVWELPPAVVEAVVVPAMRANRRYASRLGLEVARGPGAGAATVPLDSVDWVAAAQPAGPLVVRQRPGPRNVLGQFRFTLGHEPAVFLHGRAASPDRRLAATAQSSSIRLERPLEFAVLAAPGWDSTRMREAVAADPPQPVEIQSQLPIFIFHPSVRVEGGRVTFSPTVSAQDRAFADALGPPDRPAAETCSALRNAIAAWTGAVS